MHSLLIANSHILLTLPSKQPQTYNNIMALLRLILLSSLANLLNIVHGVITGYPTNQTLGFRQRNLNTIQKLYNTTIYPNNQAFIMNGASAIPPGLFSANATGRISPIGNFSGEYHLERYQTTSLPQASV